MAVSIIDMGEISKVFRKKTKQVLKQASSLSLLCFRLESPSLLSLPTYMRWSSPFIILMALCWALSSMCIPLFYWGRQIQAHGSRCVLTSGKERGRITCRAYTQAIFQVILLNPGLKYATSCWPSTDHKRLIPAFLPVSIHLTVSSSIPYFISSPMRILWKTVSKALERPAWGIFTPYPSSTNPVTKKVIRLSSVFIFISFMWLE